MLQKQIAQDPSLMQKLALMEAQSPGSTQRLYGPNAARAVQAAGLDLAGMRERGAQALYNGGTTTQQASTDPTFKGALDFSTLTGMSQPEFQTRQNTAEVGTRTKEAVIKVANMEPRLKEQEIKTNDQTIRLNDNKIVESDQAITDLRESLRKNPLMSGIDVDDVADRIYLGQPVDGATMARINNSGLKPQLEMYLNARMERARLASQMDLAQFRVNNRKMGMEDKIQIYGIISEEARRAQAEIGAATRELGMIMRSPEYRSYATSIQGKNGKKLSETLSGSEGGQAYRRAQELQGTIAGLTKDYNDNIKPKLTIVGNDLIQTSPEVSPEAKRDVAKAVGDKVGRSTGNLSGRTAESTTVSGRVNTRGTEKAQGSVKLGVVDGLDLDAIAADYAKGEITEKDLSKLPTAAQGKIKLAAQALKAKDKKK
jgi:hypothetical protein